MASALFLAATTLDVSAIGINESTFTALGGNLADPSGSMAVESAKLLAESRRPQFRSVGELTFADGVHRCTGTWLGDDASYSYVMTAAHCVVTDFRDAPWVHRTGRATLRGDHLMIYGQGTAFIPPPSITPGSGMSAQERSDSDVAVLRMPKAPGAASTPAQPLLDDIEDDPPLPAGAAGATTHFVGYGAWHVGTRPIEGDGRLWGTSSGAVTGRARQLIRVGYQPAEPSGDGFSVTAGDSGGAFWQQSAGYWRVVGTASARDAHWTASEGPRTAALIRWLKGVFPGARTFSDRLSVSATIPFTSRNHAEDVSLGTVAYVVPAQAGATGPAAVLPSSGTPAFSVIRAVVEETLTHNRVEIRLRAQRETGCGWSSRMEDDTSCGVAAPARLTVSFQAEDNPELPRGSYVGRIDIEAVGSRDAQYRQRFPLHLRIGYLLEGEVTATRAYRSPDPATAGRARDDALVRFVLPMQPQVRWQDDIDEQGRAASRLVVTVKDVLENKERPLVLRAYRATGSARCPTTVMGAAVDCDDRALRGGLTIEFVKGDNPGLPAGIYRGRVFLTARGVADSAREEQIGVDVAIQTI
ncbi:hypothetical protein CDL60_12175 [Roseateles noduli]|nr:hypothetical protein CDL60_12175 [Roseateles noduli]